MKTKAKYMPALLCPKCGDFMDWHQDPDDPAHDHVVVSCNNQGCNLKGRLFKVNWPKIEIEEVVSEDVAVN